MFVRLPKKPFSRLLAGKRVNLKWSDPDFADALWNLIIEDRSERKESWDWLESKDQLRAYLGQRSHDLHDHDVVYLMTLADEVIGTFHIHNLNYEDHKTEIGYAIAKKHEGRGYMSEALPLVVNELRRLGFNKLVISCDVENERSIKLAERHGFAREGTMIADYLKDGVFRDSALFGKLLRSRD